MGLLPRGISIGSGGRREKEGGKKPERGRKREEEGRGFEEGRGRDLQIGGGWV